MRSYRQAWNNKSLQILVRLLDLMSRNRFEAISAFFHVVTSDEELVNASDPLKKVRPLHNLIKTKALEHYQPLRELSIDERMVKSKARTKFRQYLPKKPIKWGFKYSRSYKADLLQPSERLLCFRAPWLFSHSFLAVSIRYAAIHCLLAILEECGYVIDVLRVSRRPAAHKMFVAKTVRRFRLPPCL